MSTWKPKGYNSVSPYLIASNAEEIIAFMAKVFDAKLLRRFDHPGFADGCGTVAAQLAKLVER
jgi:uncharacterized glyoxalase superfamily protein PhnB